MSYQEDFDKLLNGEYIDRCCNFYDWFCKDSSIPTKAKSLTKKVKFLVDQEIVNPETTYVWFKNNCPVNGSLYDDFRFCTKKSLGESKYLGGVCPSLGYTDSKGKCDVFLSCEDFKEILFDSWSEFKKEVKTNPEFKTRLRNALWVS